MGRRLAWAVATIHQPELLILDEPFSGLDPAGRSLMQQWIEAMRLQGTTLIVTGHDLAVLPQLSDQLLLLRAGRLVKTMQPQLDPPYFELSLGLNPENSRLFGSEKKLPTPTQVRSLERGHTKLSFTSQACAHLWLQACLQAELPLLAFGRVAPLQAEDMDDEALLEREKSKAKS